MKAVPSSRRLFLKQGTLGFGGAVLIHLVPDLLHAAYREASAAAQVGEKLAVFSPEEAVDVKAFASQIFPTDDTPGANQANVLYFIDHVLDKYEPENRDDFRECVKLLNEMSAKVIPGSTHFGALGPEQQVRVLEKFEKFARKRRSDLMGSFFGGVSNPFETMRTYVIAGFLSDPDNGGNKDMVGWQLIGFDGMAEHEPPFGFYDAELLKQDGDKQ